MLLKQKKPNQKQLRYAICICCVFTIMYETQNSIFCLVLLVLCLHNHLNDLTDSWFGWPSPTFFVICTFTEFCSVIYSYLILSYVSLLKYLRMWCCLSSFNRMGYLTGAGSDYAPFSHYLGITSMDMSYTYDKVLKMYDCTIWHIDRIILHSFAFRAFLFSRSKCALTSVYWLCIKNKNDRYS